MGFEVGVKFKGPPVIENAAIKTRKEVVAYEGYYDCGPSPRSCVARGDGSLQACTSKLLEKIESMWGSFSESSSDNTGSLGAVGNGECNPDTQGECCDTPSCVNVCGSVTPTSHFSCAFSPVDGRPMVVCNAGWTGVSECCNQRLPVRASGDPHVITIDGVTYNLMRCAPSRKGLFADS